MTYTTMTESSLGCGQKVMILKKIIRQEPMELCSYVRIAELSSFCAATSFIRPDFSKTARGKYKFSQDLKKLGIQVPFEGTPENALG